MDTVYHLNRIFQPPSPAFPYECGIDFDFRLRAPQFLGNTITNHGDTLFTIRGVENFTIRSNTPVGASWLFDTVAQVTATVDSITLKAVVATGETDSVKLVSLSNGKQFELSKQHGLIRFPAPEAGEDFYLLGRKSGLGVQPPTALDFTGFFTPGDSIFYKKKYFDAAGPSPFTEISWSRHRVPDYYLVDTIQTL